MNTPEETAWLMVKATDEHRIGPDDSIDGPVAVPSKGITVMAPTLARNVPWAIGQTADCFHKRGRQVWTPRLMRVRGDRVLGPAE